ncbi:MAG: hypothetical protein GOVbin1923_37 [Prokaryotic dsDNA virus sp.]|nr:MAG: hypothetical protein GOVbin1923_37 [Prokaryotic dsDNA virus sp.]|tara:strand:- start:13873 stop:14067 length:195 start_codon:yes stop_codon:yes gene_type:complete
MDEVSLLKIGAVIDLCERAHQAIMAERLNPDHDGSITPGELQAIERVLDGAATTLRSVRRRETA